MQAGRTASRERPTKATPLCQCGRAVRAEGGTCRESRWLEVPCENCGQAEGTGVDGVVAQGSEAGAHRGTFAAPFEDAMIGTMALVAHMATEVSVPVVASGGIISGRGIAAALRLEASAVQMGTAFLATTESGIGPAYREALLSARAEDTRVTRAFSGRPARGIANLFMRVAESALDARIPPYPFQNALTRPMRTAAATQRKAEYLSLWAGQGVGMRREMDAAALVKVLVEEMEQ